MADTPDPRPAPDRSTRSTAGLSTRARAVVRGLRERSLSVDRLVYLAALHRRAGSNPVLVFSAGKVGSTTLARSVTSATGRPVLAFHRASRQGRRRSSALWSDEGSSRRPTEDWVGGYAAARVRMRRSGRPWDVITGVRDPVARLVSATFQIGPALGLFDPDRPAAELDVEGITDRVVGFAADPTSWRWFEDELVPFTGIDVFARPFPVEQGWDHYADGRARLLVVRSEDLHRVAPDALAAFFQLGHPVPLDDRNRADAKVYAEHYARYLAEARLPTSLLEAAYDSPTARHFYSAAERDAMRSRWGAA